MTEQDARKLLAFMLKNIEDTMEGIAQFYFLYRGGDTCKIGMVQINGEDNSCIVNITELFWFFAKRRLVPGSSLRFVDLGNGRTKIDSLALRGSQKAFKNEFSCFIQEIIDEDHMDLQINICDY